MANGSRRAILLTLLCIVSATAVSGQIPFQPGWKYRSGQNIVPAFEGWERNPDGSFAMYFGYYNRNYEETIDVPTGPSNAIDPGNPDQGQPTFFLPGRHRFFFTVKIPKDWPPARRLVWTLTVRGRTEKANAFLLPEWEINTSTIQGSLTAAMDPLNQAPTIAVGPEQNQTIRFPETATLTVSASDDGRPLRRAPGSRGRGVEGRGRQDGAASPPADGTEPPGASRPEPGGGRGSGPGTEAPVSGAGLRVDWVQYRGPVGGRIAFKPATTPVADGKASTVATFSMPGRYVVRAFANDGAVTTGAEITFVVNP
jgi:hypothetical protein